MTCMLSSNLTKRYGRPTTDHFRTENMDFHSSELTAGYKHVQTSSASFMPAIFPRYTKELRGYPSIFVIRTVIKHGLLELSTIGRSLIFP